MQIINSQGARHSNPAVIYNEEITLQPEETLVLDFRELANGIYAIGTPFKNIELQNTGDEAGANVQRLVVYYNQGRNQPQKVPKNSVLADTDLEVRSLAIKNVSTTEEATFDLKLDNKQTQLEVQQQIRDKLLDVEYDNTGTGRVNYGQ